MRGTTLIIGAFTDRSLSVSRRRSSRISSADRGESMLAASSTSGELCPGAGNSPLIRVAGTSVVCGSAPCWAGAALVAPGVLAFCQPVLSAAAARAGPHSSRVVMR
ncbi:hypothetical protein [Citrobacter pasteurii]|nr:hypothetical protein [Citrobacter pasteurii]